MITYLSERSNFCMIDGIFLCEPKRHRCLRHPHHNRPFSSTSYACDSVNQSINNNNKNNNNKEKYWKE